jgi:hypothetical protein
MLHREDLDVAGRIILDWFLRETGWDGVDWIHVSHNGDQWRAVVKAVMNFRVT